MDCYYRQIKIAEGLAYKILLYCNLSYSFHHNAGYYRNPGFHVLIFLHFLLPFRFYFWNDINLWRYRYILCLKMRCRLYLSASLF